MKRAELVVLAALLVQQAGADTLVFAPVADATLYESATGSLGNSLGHSTYVGKTDNGSIRRALYRFELSLIPAGSTITSATLTLHVNRTISGVQRFYIHRLTTAWTTGTSVPGGGGGAGTTATAGDATWLHASYPGTLWTTPGGDFDPTISDFTGAGPLPGTFVPWDGPGMVADVQAWVDGTAPNHGWILVHSNELENRTTKRLTSEQGAAAGQRPRLEVVFDLPDFPAFCEGTVARCPCGNAGLPEHGCEHSFQVGGGSIEVAGSASVSADSVVLTTSNAPATTAVVFIQGDAQAGGGLGNPFGDGLLCVAGSIIRLKTKFASGGVATYPEAGDIAVSIRGMLPAAGGTRHYQSWFRNIAPWCTPDGFNLTNGRTIAWTP